MFCRLKKMKKRVNPCLISLPCPHQPVTVSTSSSFKPFRTPLALLPGIERPTHHSGPSVISNQAASPPHSTIKLHTQSSSKTKPTLGPAGCPHQAARAPLAPLTSLSGEPGEWLSMTITVCSHRGPSFSSQCPPHSALPKAYIK